MLTAPQDHQGTQNRGADALAGKRVLIYAMNYVPELIGCGRYSGDIGAYLRSRGAEVEVVTTPPHYPEWRVHSGYRKAGYSREAQDGVRIHRCPLWLTKRVKGLGRALAPLSFALSSMPVVIWRILWFRPHYVHCVEPTLFGAPAALAAAKLTGARTGLHVQDLEIDAAFAVGHVKGRFVRWMSFGMEKASLKMFDRVITISDKMRMKLVAKGVGHERLVMMRNWVDTAHIYPTHGANRFRRELGLADDAFVALYAGTIGPKQALTLVMEAAKQIGDTAVTFVIAGDGTEKAALVAQNLPNVKFLPLQPEERLNELLNLADVHLLPQMTGAADLVLPSKLGGMLASGRPLIAMADVDTEIGQFLADEAILVPAGDVATLVERLRQAAATHPRQRTDPRQSLALAALSKEAAMRALTDIILRP